MVYIRPHSLPPSTGYQIRQESFRKRLSISRAPLHRRSIPLPGSTLSGPPCLSREVLSCHPIGNMTRVATCAPPVLTSGTTFSSLVYANEVFTTECRKALLLGLKFKTISVYSSIENEINAHISALPWYLATHLKSSTVTCGNSQCLSASLTHDSPPSDSSVVLEIILQFLLLGLPVSSWPRYFHLSW